MTTRVRRRAHWRGAFGVAVVALLLGGCTGVPSSSDPQTIKSVPLGATGGEGSLGPTRGVAPNALVTEFLAANAVDPDNHTSAKLFLTKAARNRWSDTTATVIDGETVGVYTPGDPTIVVKGRVVGTIDASGIYTPSLLGTGDGAEQVPFEYTVKQVDGQWRIDNPHNGLLLTTEQFAFAYTEHDLYFYDVAGRYLVPDPRWTALTDTAGLSNWLIAQLVTGPRPELQTAVNSDTLPTQASTRRLSVSVGSPTSVEIPGSSQLDGGARDRLAAQLGATLDAVVRGGELRITDGGAPVRIPDSDSTTFNPESVAQAGSLPTPSPELYYLRDGKLVAQNGRQLSGAVNGKYFLNSVALSRSVGPGLSVAAVSGTGTQARLYVGSQTDGLEPTAVRGELSRPSWAPARPEIWIGDGGTLYRVTVAGKIARPASVSLPSGVPGGRILAVRVSPDGSRVALAIASANGSQQLFVGPIVRTGGQVRIDRWMQVSPAKVGITDVAWVEPLKLYAIGTDTASGEARVFDTVADGSLWTQNTQGNLPEPLTALTVASGQRAWVAAGNSVWYQTGATSWQSPGRTGQTLGTNPIFLE